MSQNDDSIALDRRLELMADRALGGLDSVEAAELARLAPLDDPDGLALELAAAALELSRIGVTGHPDLPEGVADRIERRMSRITRPGPSGSDFPSRSGLRVSVSSWAGWVAAAASIALVVYDRSNPPPQPAPAPRAPVAMSLQDRLRSAPSSRLVATAHPLARGAGGTMVWDSNRQEGYLQIQGLAPVNPKLGCYQLWVFDAERDGRYPVDGGMFTISSESGEAVVPVHPDLPVREPTLFAVTLEPPGGVVVSDRERILLTADWRGKPLGGPPGR